MIRTRHIRTTVKTILIISLDCSATNIQNKILIIVFIVKSIIIHIMMT